MGAESEKTLIEGLRMNDQLPQLGKRDALAETFMRIKMKGERTALREIAEELHMACQNPHAIWYLQNHEKHPDAQD